MIFQKINKIVSLKGLFYKVLYFFTKPNNLVLLGFSPNKNILLLVSIIFTRVGKNFLNFDVNSLNSKWIFLIYKISLCVRVFDSLCWRFLREDRHFNYYNIRLLQYYSYLYPTLCLYLQAYSRIFYNSFHNKLFFLRTYGVYKNVHLSEFLVKFYFNFENTYFFNFLQGYDIVFNLKDEFFKIPFFLLKNKFLFTQNMPIEFIIFKKNFFKNDLYSFFYRRSAFFFSLKKNFDWSDYKGFEKHEFMQIKPICSNSDIEFFEKKNITNTNYTNYKKFFIYLFRVTTLLILISDNKFF